QEVTRLHAQICSALSDPRRIMMLYLLAQRPWSVTDLAHEIGISQPAASRHLKVLRERGLVTATRRGASVEYALADRRLIQALDTLRQVLYDSVSTRASLLEQAQAQTAAQPAAESKPSSRENAL
ncbi:MAG: ArsR family transcriptional regulator, partial [Anaerolineae bacterium]